MKKVAIIGAGLSGLAAAHLLKDNADVTLFEKACGVSGRVSARRAPPYVFDHGAQYFTARTKPFQDFIQPLIKQGIIERWNARYVKLKGQQIIERTTWTDQPPRYVGVPGMNQIGKFLAQGLNIHLNTKIVSLTHQKKWHLIDDQGMHYPDFDWVICTTPAPQAATLLPKFFSFHRAIQTIQMNPCFSLMLGFKNDLLLEFDAAHVTDANISWIALNRHKPKRSGPFTLLIHSSSEYANTHFNDHIEDVMQHLITEASGIMGYDLNIADHRATHRWAYATNTIREEKSPLFLDKHHQLAACGDWCYGGRIEGAFTSAYDLALKMKENVL